MKRLLKRIAARLPIRWQQELKRKYFQSEIRAGRFRTDEREYSFLSMFISPGDCVLDIGANVGHYTIRLSELVGKNGRVVSFEPVPGTFELLAANAARVLSNITLINAAASDSSGIVGMEVPRFDTGLDNFYMAHLSKNRGAIQVLSMPVDSLMIPLRVSLVKIDAEGSELQVLRGMVRLLKRDHPTLIVEDNVSEVTPFLTNLGYWSGKIKGSSNRIFCSDLHTAKRLFKSDDLGGIYERSARHSKA